MDLPLPGDYIDIHTHGSGRTDGIFAVENLMAHESRMPEDIPGRACTYGIHPWYLKSNTMDHLIERVYDAASRPGLIAIGETGFDKLRGPSADIQMKTFEKQVRISEEIEKPVVIHCVRSWDELLNVHKRLKPVMPWLIHGFRGRPELAKQLISKGMFLSFWFDFVVRPEASALLKSMPKERIFLETDGAEVDIRSIYEKVSRDMDITVDDMKKVVSDNFKIFFNFSY